MEDMFPQGVLWTLGTARGRLTTGSYEATNIDQLHLHFVRCWQKNSDPPMKHEGLHKLNYANLSKPNRISLLHQPGNK